MGRISEYYSPWDSSSPLTFLKHLKTNAYIELILLKDPTSKSDFDTYYAMIVFYLPEKLMGNQYHEVSRKLVTPQRLFPSAISETFEKHCLC